MFVFVVQSGIKGLLFFTEITENHWEKTDFITEQVYFKRLFEIQNGLFIHTFF